MDKGESPLSASAQMASHPAECSTAWEQRRNSRDLAMEHTGRHQPEKFVGVAEAPALTVSAIEKAEIKATHLRWKDSESGLPTRCELADGYVVFLLRSELPAHPAWVDERPAPIATIRQGQFLLLDLRAQHSALVRGDVDCLSVYTGSDALRRFQEEHELPPTGLLRTPLGRVYEDDVIRHLGEALLPAIDQPQSASQLYVSHVALALFSRLTAQHGTDPLPMSQLRGGLAPWQERRAKEMLMAHLDGRIGLEALAAECRLSRSHFARAFKISTGISPLRWLTGQRIERAKIQLLNTDLTLEQIAASCGFADASHLARAFSRTTRLQPGAWRRLRF
jgi:AraC-like DNA-binding protein